MQTDSSDPRVIRMMIIWMFSSQLIPFIQRKFSTDISLLLKQQGNAAKEPIHVGQIFLTVQSLINDSYALACACVWKLPGDSVTLLLS
jgi:hypothetical protein